MSGTAAPTCSRGCGRGSRPDDHAGRRRRRDQHVMLRWNLARRQDSNPRRTNTERFNSIACNACQYDFHSIPVTIQAHPISTGHRSIGSSFSTGRRRANASYRTRAISGKYALLEITRAFVLRPTSEQFEPLTARYPPYLLSDKAQKSSDRFPQRLSYRWLQL